MSEFSAVEDTASITVSDVNDAPVLTATSPSLPTITEDDVNNGGIGIATLLGANVSDVDAGAIEGVAVTSLVSGNGTWQFSTDGGTSWSDVGAVSETSALLLTSSDAIRFVPDGENGTSPSFDFRAWDQSSGSGGAKVDVSTNGGTTAFSSVSDTASVTVTDVNDAPVLTATGPSLNPITEDALTNSGQTVASILGANVSDVDSGAVEGIAITGRGTSSGVWEFSTDGGTNWIDFGTVSDSQSLLLRANDLVRFVPDGENGEVTSFDFRAWDQTAGTEGTKVDSTTNGGTSEFSAVEDTASIVVSDVNDAPVLTATSPSLPTITEDDVNNGGIGIATLLGANVSDVDAGAIEGVAVTSLVSGNGTWQFSTDGGTSWSDVGAVSETSALLLTSSDAIRFVPDGENGTSPSFDFRAWDQSSGSGGAKVDVSTNGGTTAFSSVSDTASVTVTDVNDAPVLTATGPSLTGLNEDATTNGGQTVASILGSNVSDVDSGAVEGIAITGRGASSGDWEYSIDGGTNWIDFGTVSDSQSLLLRANDLVRFVPDGENGEVTSFDFRAWDQTAGTEGTKVDSTTNGGTSEFSAVEDTASITVSDVNDAPVLTATSPSLPTITEDDVNNGGQTVASFLDVNVDDVDNGAVEGIAVTGRASSNGVWEFSTDGGTSWTAFGSVSDSQSLLLRASDMVRFVPDGENGETTSFDFRAWDQTVGTAGTKVDSTTNGGTSEFSAVEDTAAITVTNVNDAPVLMASNPTLPTITEDNLNEAGQTIATLLGANVSDVDAGAVEGIAVTGSVSNGIWQYSTDGGTSWLDFGAVSDSQSLLLSSTDMVRFVPDGENGETASFDFRAWDQTVGSVGDKVDSSTNGGTSEFSAVEDMVTVTVTDVNDAPVLTETNPSLPTITENDVNNSGQTVASFLDINVDDVDNGAVEGIAITGRSSSSGVWEYSIDGGTSWTNFGVVSDSQSLLLGANDLVRFVPDGENGEVTSFDFRAWDQTVGTVGTKVDSTTHGGTSEFSAVEDTATITVTDVNDAPVLTATNPTMPTITEDNLNDAGQTVATLLGANVSDVDNGAVEGIAVTGRSASSGRWEYSLDGGLSWMTIGTVSDSQSLLLGTSDLVRFIPDGENGETATFDFRAWDQTSGSAGDKVDSTTNGGTSEFSAVEDTVSITVTDVNDAPVLNANNPSLPTITEDESNNSGAQVSSLLGSSVGDVDNGAVEGLAVTQVSSGNGTWQFSTDGGTSWIDVGAVSETNALLLNADDFVRFVPDGENADAASFDFRAWDQTSGTNGTKVDVSANGGTTPFSSATDTASITITAVNDAPVLTASSPSMPTITEDNLNDSGQTVGTLLGGNFSDVDSGAVAGIAVTGRSSSNGRFEYSLDGGTTWSNLGAVSETQSLLLRSSDLIRFVPDGENGETADFDFRAWDQTVGVAGDKVDSSINGGTSQFSSVEDTASITVLDVNDAPVLTPSNPNFPSITEDDVNNTGMEVSVILGGTDSDVDNDPFRGIAIQELSASNGTWQYSLDNGATWANVGAVSESSALLLREGDRVRYLPDAENGETADFDFRAWDQTVGAVGTKVDAGTNGGTSAFSAAVDTAEITVNSVNDAPELVASSPNLTPITEDNLNPTGDSVASLLGLNLTDVDTGSVKGIAVTDSFASFGDWEYSLDGGLSWNSIGAVNENSALLLSATDFVRYVPDGTNGETASIDFRAWDQSNGTVGDRVDVSSNGGTTAFSSVKDVATIVSASVNDNPVATGETMNLDEGATLTTDAASGLLANDFDVDVGDVLVPVVETLPAHGTLVVNSDGSFEYVHDGSETLTDSFTYKVVDGTGESSVVVVNLSINPINDAPIGQEDTYEIDAGGILLSPFSVLANDTDAENNPIVAVLVSPPANGFLSFRPDGTFVYTPEAGFFGVETFTYVANDGSVNGAVVTVTITVNAANTDDGNGDGTGINTEEVVDPVEEIQEEIIERPTRRVEKVTENQLAGSEKKVFVREEIFNSFPTQKDAETALNLVFNEFKHYSNYISNEDLAVVQSNGNTVVFDGAILLSQLDDLREQFGSNDNEFHFDMNLTFSTSALAVAAGYIVWTIRGGVLMATMISSLPTWRFVDPLPILESNTEIFGEEKALDVFDE